MDDSGVGFIFTTADQTDRLDEDDRVLLPLHHDQEFEE